MALKKFTEIKKTIQKAQKLKKNELLSFVLYRKSFSLPYYCAVNTLKQLKGKNSDKKHGRNHQCNQ
jgi:hypothetical protein